MTLGAVFCTQPYRRDSIFSAWTPELVYRRHRDRRWHRRFRQHQRRSCRHAAADDDAVQPIDDDFSYPSHLSHRHRTGERHRCRRRHRPSSPDDDDDSRHVHADGSDDGPDGGDGDANAADGADDADVGALRRQRRPSRTDAVDCRPACVHHRPDRRPGPGLCRRART